MIRPSSTTATTAGPLRYAPFRWYFTGNVVSQIGSAMAPIALAFAVLEKSGSSADLGLTLAARSIPLIVFLLVGGAIADRYPRERVLIAANLGAFLTQGSVAAYLISGHFNVAVVAGVELLNGAITAFTSPASRGIVPQLLPKDALQRGVALNGLLRNATKIFGPAIAGVLVAGVGGGWAIAIDALSFLGAAVCVAQLSIKGHSHAGSSTVLSDIREGWQAFRSMTWVWSIVGSSAVTNCLRTGVWSVLGPAIALSTIGSTGWGVVSGVRAAGVVILTAVMYRLALRRALAVGQLAMVAGAVPLLALGLHGNTLTLSVAAFVAGAASGMFGPGYEATLQSQVPRDLRSRISSYDDLGSFITVPIGQVAAGPLAQLCGASTIAIAAAGVWVVAAALPLIARSVRTAGVRTEPQQLVPPTVPA